MKHDARDLVPAPSQTVGPFFHIGLAYEADSGKLAGDQAVGNRIRLVIRVLDAEGAGVPDALIELWQADANGNYNHPDDPRQHAADPAFRGHGRQPSDNDGITVFETVRPGRVAGVDGELQAPHINVHIFARGILRHISTRIYFTGDPANSEDAILRLIPLERRETLLARDDRDDQRTWCIDFRLSGAGETVFFDA